MQSPRPSARRSARRWSSLVLASLLASVVPLVVPASPASATDDTFDSVIDITFPTLADKVTFGDWYDAARSGGRVHKATDIMGSKLLPIFAAAGGEVVRMPMADDVHGYRLSVLGDDGRTYGYLHLNNDTPGTDDGRGTAAQAYAPGVELGGRVERGQHIAWMGDSGNAEATAPHLHFSISDPDIVDPYGTTIRDPYPSLMAAKAAGRVPSAASASAPPAVAATPPPPPPPPAPDLTSLCGATVRTQSFSDLAATNVHSLAVECLAAKQVTYGIGDGRYAPSEQVTRLQMASFTARLLEAGGVALPLDPADAFDDDAGTVHELAVNQLVELGVIRHDTGEVGRDFQGRVAMKRDRMAAWMARAYGLIAGRQLPTSTSDHFTDDDRYHHADINRLADAGIVQGSRPGAYSPRDSVRRDQMGSYLARTLAAALAS